MDCQKVIFKRMYILKAPHVQYSTIILNLQFFYLAQQTEGVPEQRVTLMEQLNSIIIANASAETNPSRIETEANAQMMDAHEDANPTAIGQGPRRIHELSDMFIAIATVPGTLKYNFVLINYKHQY